MVVFVDAEAAHVFGGKVDAVAVVVVGANILPEIRELERGAGVVGESEALGIAIAAGVKDEMADRVGRVMAVAKHVGHGFEAGDGLVLSKCYEQVGEGRLGDVAGADGFSESDEDRMTGFAAITGVEFLSPEIE